MGDDFGIGAKANYSILDIAKMFSKEIEMLPERAGNRMSSFMDTKKTEELGWDTEKELVEHIDEFKKNLK